jgi:hypothetical protein
MGMPTTKPAFRANRIAHHSVESIQFLLQISIYSIPNHTQEPNPIMDPQAQGPPGSAPSRGVGE